MLEEMSAFFERRLDGYDEHMLNNIEGAKEFYPFTASCLPKEQYAGVLDLGCGTGIELEEYFKINPSAHLTGIDLSRKMLDELKKKLGKYDITLIQGSYFSLDLGTECFCAAVSVESLHHFTAEEKLPLYKNLHRSLCDGGYFILTDYFATTEQEQEQYRAELIRLKQEAGARDDAFYHYDTPLTVENEIKTLSDAGFSDIKIIGSWGATHTIKAIK